MALSSNRTIMGLLFLAFTLSILTTVVTLSKFDAWTLLEEKVTGAASTSASGESNLTIVASTSITNNVGSINFGTGYVNASCVSCMLDSNGSFGTNSPGSYNFSCCVNFTNVTSGFLLENTGNLNISVNYSCLGSCTAADFIGAGTNLFQFITAPNSLESQSPETGQIDTALSCFQNNSWNTTTYTSVSTAGQYLCGNSTVYPLDFDNTRDAAVVHIRVNISSSTIGTGTRKNATFTFGALSSG
ncbi:TPA: hypothetical protein HA241_01870 [Candidatus Woesearchaeota archaeon]|nr:hypothetical protein [Candidatus Woesearchaeota archaeon]